MITKESSFEKKTWVKWLFEGFIGSNLNHTVISWLHSDMQLIPASMFKADWLFQKDKNNWLRKQVLPFFGAKSTPLNKKDKKRNASFIGPKH